MPKDEFDFDDPLELNGMAFATHEDTTDPMCECFIEEFLRMRYQPEQILALFRNPNYLGPNMALQKRGESYVRGIIVEVFGRWGRIVDWRGQKVPPAPQSIPLHQSARDPLGAPVPEI